MLLDLHRCEPARFAVGDCALEVQRTPVLVQQRLKTPMCVSGSDVALERDHSVDLGAGLRAPDLKRVDEAQVLHRRGARVSGCDYVDECVQALLALGYLHNILPVL